jgi:hypothetical protein
MGLNRMLAMVPILQEWADFRRLRRKRIKHTEKVVFILIIKSSLCHW